MPRAVTIAVVLLLAASLGAQREPGRRQPRAFDPVDPLWDHEWPIHVTSGVQFTANDIEQLDADRDELIVDLQHDRDVLTAALRRERIVRLIVREIPREAVPLPWAALVRHEELRSLVLQGKVELTAAQVRELRRLPSLQSLVLVGCATLDQATAEALLELPKLRHLGLSRVPVEPGALRRLAGLPDLVSISLGFAWPPDQIRAQLGELAGLPQLRELVLTGGSDDLPKVVGELAKVPQLRRLMLTGGVCDDELLAALPPTLTGLALMTNQHFTADGLRQLGQRLRLQSFGLRGSLLPEVSAALAELLATSPIERLDLYDVPDARVTSALAALPGLRRLSTQVHRSGWPALVELCGRLPRLEKLTVRAPVVPAPSQLAGLHGHPSLRHVGVEHSGAPFVMPNETQRAALRAATGSEVDVR